MGPDDDAIFQDADTGDIIGVVLRGFIADKEIVEWIGDILKQAVNMRRNCRRDDGGSLVQVGYTTGSQHRPVFDWAKNITATKSQLAKMDFADLEFQTGSVFALIWNMFRHRLPQSIMANWYKVLEDIGVCRMDGGLKGDGDRSEYTIMYGGLPYSFFTGELAPPMGMIGKHYSRHIHKEGSPVDHLLSYQCRRSLGKDGGGSFFYASHGIQVIQTANMVITHRPKILHGTALQLQGPNGEHDESDTLGLSFLLAPKLPKVWKAYQEGKMGHEAAEAEMEKEDHDKFET